jgi:outer membrane immunogenic protein
MKKLLVATTALVALSVSVPAMAADLAARPYTKAPPIVAPIATWAGFYVGVQGGGAWGTSDETFTGIPNERRFRGTQSYDTSGGFVGGVAGYNWQFANVVLGVEGDYHWADIDGHSGEVFSGTGDGFHTKLRGFGDIKGRLGYATGPALLFVSGGAAVGDFRHSYESPFGSIDSSDTRWGWTVGAGAEYMFAPSWSAKVEYDYIDFGKSKINLDPGFSNVGFEWKDTIHTVKAGVSYHFGGPVVARY